jgi:hypothetical protein
VLATATLLGGASAVWFFVDKCHEHREPTVATKTSVAIPTGVNAPPRASGGSATTQPTEDLPQGEVPALTLEATIRTLEDPALTPLQKSLFVHREEGRTITWIGEVRSVRKMWESEDASDLLVVLAAHSGPQNRSEIAVASFPSSETTSLAQLAVGDVAVVQGTLHFDELAGSWSPTLDKSRLVRFERHAQVN